MKADELKGKALVSISDGAKLGYVQSILFDTEQRVLAALIFEMDGQRALLPFKEITSIGSDAITVANTSVTQGTVDQNPLSTWPDLDHVQKLKVVDDGGTLLGLVSSVEVDPATGRITSISVHKGGILGMGGTTQTVAADDIHGIGAEVMMVATGAVQQS